MTRPHRSESSSASLVSSLRSHEGSRGSSTRPNYSSIARHWSIRSGKGGGLPMDLAGRWSSTHMCRRRWRRRCFRTSQQPTATHPDGHECLRRTPGCHRSVCRVRPYKPFGASSCCCGRRVVGRLDMGGQRTANRQVEPAADLSATGCCERRGDGRRDGDGGCRGGEA